MPLRKGDEQFSRIGSRRCAPPKRVQERIETRGIDRARSGLRQAGPFDCPGSRLDLPDDLERLVRLGIVIDGLQGD